MSVEDLKAAKGVPAKEALAELERVERTSGNSGVVPHMPKQMLFDKKDLDKRHPDKRLHWVNLRNTDKVLSRTADGWSRLPEDENNGGRHLGDEYAVFALPREEYERRVQNQRRLHAQRLGTNRDEFEKSVEATSRMLRDKYGINIPPERLLNV